MNDLDRYLKYAERISLINHADVREKLFEGLLNQIEYDAWAGVKFNLPIKRLSALNFQANKVQEVKQEKLNRILTLIKEDKKWIKSAIEQGMRTITFRGIDGYSNPVTSLEEAIFTDSEFCKETVFNKEQKDNLFELFVEERKEKLQPIFFSFLDDYRQVVYMAQVDKKWFKSNE